MMRHVRTARFAPGKQREGLELALRIRDHLVAQGYPSKVFVRAFGPLGTVAWALDVDDLTSLQDTLGKLMVDTTYQAMLDEAQLVYEDAEDELYLEMEPGMSSV